MKRKLVLAEVEAYGEPHLRVGTLGPQGNRHVRANGEGIEDQADPQMCHRVCIGFSRRVDDVLRLDSLILQEDATRRDDLKLPGTYRRADCQSNCCRSGGVVDPEAV